MSADNWTKCPSCKAKQAKEQDKLETRLAESYGKVPVDEWLALSNEVSKPPKLEDTLREDYEVGIYDDDTFFVDYRGSCQACGWSYKYRYEDKKLIK